MALPDVSRLLGPGERWRELAARLRAIGATPARAQAIVRIGDQTRVLSRQPLRNWHLRRAGDPAAHALRLLFFGDSVTTDEARAALGPVWDDCVTSGLVVQSGDAITSPFHGSFANDKLVMCDDLRLGGDVVMGPGETTGDLARIAYPAADYASALDLGCGAGTIALLLAGRVPRVVGTDVNERAIVLSRFNALVNELSAIEWRAGDMFAPVADESFDLVVAQPPFVPRHRGATDTTYLFGGDRGDEIVMRAFAELGPHLGPRGRAVFLVMWPYIDGDPPVHARVRAALGDPSLAVTVFEGPTVDLDDWCTGYSAREHPDLGAAFEEATIARREHLERVGTRALRMSAVLVDRVAEGRAWATNVPISSIANLRNLHVDVTIAGRRLLARGRDALLAAKLRAAAGATFSDDGAGQVTVRFDDGSPWPSVQISAGSYSLVGALDEAPDVASAVRELEQRARAPRDAIVGAVEQAIAHGVVEVV